MIVKLKKITLENFKGVKNAEYVFHPKSVISGENGAGKTTIVDLFYWVMCNKNYQLVENPGIRPNDCEDAISPKGILEMEIDGKPVTISKVQKLKRSKPDDNGVTKISLTNSYKVNEVPKSERDFKAYLAEIGVDVERFLMLSHPDLFVSGMKDKKSRDEMRDTLFKMAKTYSDKEIADMSEEMVDLSKLLNEYKVDEVEAMQKATLRKIKEDYGKDGEILLAKIAGLDAAKSNEDVSTYIKEKEEIRNKLADLQAKKNDLTAQTIDYDKASENVLNLKFQLGEMERKIQSEYLNSKSAVDKEIRDKEAQLISIQRYIQDATEKINEYAKDNANKEKQIKELQEEWRTEKNVRFNEDSLNCPYCGQLLPPDRQESIKADFNKKQKERLDEITQKGLHCREVIDHQKAMLSELKQKIDDEYNPKEKEIKCTIENLKNDIPAEVDISKNAEYQKLKAEYEKQDQALSKKVKIDSADTSYQMEIAELNSRLIEVEKQIAVVDNNENIDKQIENLHKEQIEFEQSKADAEKILYQLSLLNKKKNELMEASINEHFKIVKWKLWDRQKNGEYLSVCIPTIDGKQFGQSMNTGLETLAKLDIVNGLQTYFEQYYPVFLDGAECLSSVTEDQIDLMTQLIELRVSEDKEIKVS